MPTNIDFTITGTVFLHNRAWKPGQEAALEKAGFSDEDKAHQVRCGAIAPLAGANWHRDAPGTDATDGAIRAAAEAGVDLADVQDFIGGGRVGKADIDRFMKTRADTEDSAT